MPRDIPISRLRNFGIMAHIDAGKTTVAERILFFTGRVRAPGEVHHGNTLLDDLPQERDKGITITAAATTVSWTPKLGLHEGAQHRLQLVDTPGHIDFTLEVERSLRVLDGAVFVLDASSGVECQSETVWHQAERHEVPSIAFLNKVDKVGADVEMCLRELEERLGARPVLVNLPGEDGTLLDVLRRRKIRFEGRLGWTFVTEPLAPLEVIEVDAQRARLIERCADCDEEVLDAYCQGTAPSELALERALRKGTLQRSLLVVLCGSALKNRGVQQLLDAIVAYLPSPADLPPALGTKPGSDEALARAPSDDEAFAGLAWKTVSDKSAGLVTFVRIYSGTLAAGTEVRVLPRGTRERVTRMFVLHGGGREDIAIAHAGAIIAVAGLKTARTGDTLCALDAPIVLERIEAPEPVVEISIEPRTAADRDRLGEALHRTLACDSSLRVSSHPETGQTILSGMGQLHLEIAVDRLRTEHQVAVRMGTPEVAYRETVAREAKAEYRHIKQEGGSGQHAVVTLVVRPLPRGTGLTFADDTVGGVVPKEFVPSVERGARGAAARGVLAGYPVIDVEVRLVDGAFHVKDSNAAAFEIAGSLAFQAAARAAGLLLLEPWTSIEVTVPEAQTGLVAGDLASRRGLVIGITPKGTRNVVRARAPLASMFDWVSRLRSLTGGRGSALVTVDGYDVVPEAIERAVLARA